MSLLCYGQVKKTRLLTYGQSFFTFSILEIIAWEVDKINCIIKIFANKCNINITFNFNLKYNIHLLNLGRDLGKINKETHK